MEFKTNMAWNTVNTESDKVKAAIIQADSGAELYFLYENDKFLFVTDDIDKVNTTTTFLAGKNVSVYVSVDEHSERIF